MLRCLLEGLVWLLGLGKAVQVSGKSGLAQAGRRMGWDVIPKLCEQVGNLSRSKVHRKPTSGLGGG